MKKLNIGILSTARINKHAIIRPAKFLQNVEVYAIASRNGDKARNYSQRHRIEKAFSSYQDLIEDPLVDLVYISLPNHLHAEWILKSMKAGKHVLCEKPLVLSLEEISRIKRQMQGNIKVIEALHYKYHPLMIQAKQFLDQGQIGEVQSVKIVFNRPPPFADDIRLNPHLDGNGCLYDLGVYCIDVVRFLFDCNDIRVLSSSNKKNRNGVILESKADLSIKNKIGCRIECSFGGISRYIEISGEKGQLFIFNPFTHDGKLYVFKIKYKNKFFPNLRFFDTSSTYYHQIKNVFNVVSENSLKHINDLDNSYENIRFIEQMQ